MNPKYATPRHLGLPDGRRLCYAECGDPRGKPVMVFHGLPGTRLQCQPRRGGEELGLRWIMPDRPGVGQSDYQRGRRITDWPLDVAHLADHLGIAAFALCGWSGGGPYVAACAALLPRRITHAVIIGCVAPMDGPGGLQGMALRDRLLLNCARRAPWLAKLPIALLGAYARLHPRGHQKRFVDTLSPVDKRLFDDPGFRRMMLDDLGESLRCGNRGVAREIQLLASPWGFEPERIAIPVTLLQGEQDQVTPPHMGRFVAQRIPRCDAVFLPGEGHFLMYHLWPHLIDCLVTGRWRGPRNGSGPGSPMGDAGAMAAAPAKVQGPAGGWCSDS